MTPAQKWIRGLALLVSLCLASTEAAAAPPGNFTVTGSAYCDTTNGTSTGAVHLSWGASSTATSYDIIRDGSVRATVGATQFSFDNNGSNLAGGTYSYVIRAHNSSTTTTDTPAITVTVPSTICGSTTPPGNFTVTVTRSDTNALLSGATVTLSGGPSSPPSQPTGSDGTTTFANLAVGSYTVTASLAGYQTNNASATVVANTTTPVTVSLTPLPQQAKKRVVILVHGILGSSGSFGLMRNFLESTGKFRVYYFDYRTLSNWSYVDAPIPYIATLFKHRCIDNIKKGKVCANPGEDPDQAQPIEDIENIDTSSVDIVAHSMGGLVALSYISEQSGLKYENDVGKLVTLATPFFGAHFAGNELLELVLSGKQVDEMAFGSKFLWELSRKWKTTIDSGVYKKTDILNVVGTRGSEKFRDSDMVVPIASAVVLPDLDLRSRYVPKCHMNESMGPLGCHSSDAIAYVLNESHPSYKLVESFLRNGSDPDNCPEPECSPTPPTNTGDLFVWFVEKTNPQVGIGILGTGMGSILTFDPDPSQLGASLGFERGGWDGKVGTLLVQHLPAGWSYKPTVHGLTLDPRHHDGVLEIASIRAGRTTVLPQIELEQMESIYAVMLTAVKDYWVVGKDVFKLDVQLTIPTAQSFTPQSLASDALSQSTLIDGYIWTEIPGGGRFFLQPDFINFTDQRTPVISSFPMQNFAGTVLSMFIPPDLPTGTYTFFAVGVVPGSDPLNSANWVTNRAELAVTVTQ